MYVCSSVRMCFFLLLYIDDHESKPAVCIFGNLLHLFKQQTLCKHFANAYRILKCLKCIIHFLFKTHYV